MKWFWELVVYVIVDRCSPSRRYARYGRQAIRAMYAQTEKGAAK